jgi:hypothetical protein
VAVTGFDGLERQPNARSLPERLSGTHPGASASKIAFGTLSIGCD